MCLPRSDKLNERCVWARVPSLVVMRSSWESALDFEPETELPNHPPKPMAKAPKMRAEARKVRRPPIRSPSKPLNVEGSSLPSIAAKNATKMSTWLQMASLFSREFLNGMYLGLGLRSVWRGLNSSGVEFK